MKKFLTMIVVIILAATLAIGLAACDKNKDPDTLRFVMPDGTPTLAAAKMFSEYKTLDGKNMEYEIVAATSLPGEMGAGKADIVIMPTNAGLAQIAKGADYKLAAVSVLGSLYIVGANDSKPITMEDLKGKTIGSIGEGNTPDLVFKHIIANTDGISYTDFTVNFYDEAPQVKQALVKGDIDYALVGEPAATAFSAGQSGYGRMDLQTYWATATGFENFPQASLFVKSSLCENEGFMTKLLAALAENEEWVKANSAGITDYLKGYDSTSTFPAASIDRCAVTMLRASENKEMITAYMRIITGKADWSNDAAMY